MSDLGNVKKMFGQELNISVTNADANVIANTPRLVPNTIIISSPQNANEKKDIIENNIHQASLFATDYNGVPVQITHVIKIGNGLYMDESRAIALGIDNQTLVTDNSSNKLRVQTTELAKASSVSLGVVKTASTCQRSADLFPKLGNMTGISINSDGELFITDQILQIIYNYINDRIASEIAPLLEVKSDLRLIDNYNIIYYPSTISSVSIQIIGLALNNENNSIGVFNKIQFTSTQDNPLIVTFNIRTDSGYPIKIANMELVSNVYGSDTISEVLMYHHQVENIFFEFYPNLLTQSIDYQITCNIKDNDANMIVEDTVFKFNQQNISNNKNELFSVSSIIIEDEENDNTKTKISSIQIIINSIIRNYIINDIIPSLTLNLSYKINNALVNIPLDINKDNIDNILVGNEDKISNLSGLTDNTEISWSIIANLNLNIGNEINDTVEFNNGLINVYKNSYNVRYIVYYVNGNTRKEMNNTDQTVLDYDETVIKLNDRKYILQLVFPNRTEYNLFKNEYDQNNLEFNIYIGNSDGSNYFLIEEDDEQNYVPVWNDPRRDIEWDSIEPDDSNFRLDIIITDNILLNNFIFEVKKNGNRIMGTSFTSNITSQLVSMINNNLTNMYENMLIGYDIFKQIDNQLIINVNETVYNNFIIANRTDISTNFCPFLVDNGDNKYSVNLPIHDSGNALLSISDPTKLEFYYYVYEQDDDHTSRYFIMPLYNNIPNNSINLYNMKVELLKGNNDNVFYDIGNDNCVKVATTSLGSTYHQVSDDIKNGLKIDVLINKVFMVKKNNNKNIDINLYLLLTKYITNDLESQIRSKITIYESDDTVNYFVVFNEMNTLTGKPEGIRFENNIKNNNNTICFKLPKQNSEGAEYYYYQS